MKYIFVDLEMNPVSRKEREARKTCRNEVIEIGAVALDAGSEDLQEIDSFKLLVRPQFSQQVYQRYALLTGITTDMLVNAVHFSDALAAFLVWCGDDYQIFSWSDNDLSQLREEAAFKKVPESAALAYLFSHWQDFQRQFCRLLNLNRQLALEKALDSVGIAFAGQAHDALWDARNTADLYRLTRDEEQFKKLLASVAEAKEEALQAPATFALNSDALAKLAALKEERTAETGGSSC